MGYATREIHLAKRKKQGDLRVTLREDSQQLKEVVVTAMGIKKDTKRAGLRGEHYRIGRDSEGGSNQLCIRHVR